MPQVVIVGSINVDLHLLLTRHILPGETLLAGGGTYSPGGKGANQACAAALAGASTAMAGAVGSDGFALTPAANVRTLALVEVVLAQIVSGRLMRQETTPRQIAGMALIVAGVGALILASR